MKNGQKYTMKVASEMKKFRDDDEMDFYLFRMSFYFIPTSKKKGSAMWREKKKLKALAVEKRSKRKSRNLRWKGIKFTVSMRRI